MEELHFTGNCLKGSRPVLSFDATFDSAPHLRLLKEMFLHIFGVPKGARKVKPFVDHVMGFTIADGKIWVRNYQINEAIPSAVAPKDSEDAEAAAKKARKDAKHGETELSLVEIGPRFVLTPIVILEGSFGGPVIYENKEFVSPNQVRSDLRKSKAQRYNQRAEQGIERLARHDELGLRTDGKRNGPDELDTKTLFA
jgi:ribosome biogenesis protein BRX1